MSELDLSGVDDIERMASAVAKVTPCACSAQRARADKAEAEVERLRKVAEAAANAVAAMSTTWPWGAGVVESDFVEAVREWREAGE